MKSKILKIFNGIIWVVIAAVLLLAALGFLSGDVSGGSFAAIATVSALTAILWAPVLLVIACIAFVLEIQRMRTENRAWTSLFRKPSTYVLLAMLYILYVMFLG